jgi:hypothetical protein
MTVKFPAFLLSPRLLGWGNLADLTAARPGHSPKPQQQGQAIQETASAPISTLQEGLLSVRVRNASSEPVLPEIEPHTGIGIRLRGQLSGTLTHAFAGRPLERGRRRFLRRANPVYVDTTRKGQDTATEVPAAIGLFPQEGHTAAGNQRTDYRSAPALEPQQAIAFPVKTAKVAPEAKPAEPETARAVEADAQEVEFNAEREPDANSGDIFPGLVAPAQRRAVMHPRQSNQTRQPRAAPRPRTQTAVGPQLTVPQYLTSPLGLSDWQHRLLCELGQLHAFEGHATLRRRLRGSVTVAALIHQGDVDPGAYDGLHRRSQLRHSRQLLFACRGDMQGQQVAQGIDRHGHLAAPLAWRAVIASPWTTLGRGPPGMALEDGCRRPPLTAFHQLSHDTHARHNGFEDGRVQPALRRLRDRYPEG